MEAILIPTPSNYKASFADKIGIGYRQTECITFIGL